VLSRVFYFLFIKEDFMRSVIIDSRMSDKCKLRLSALGFHLLELPPCPTLPSAIASHPDTLICRIGDSIITTADYCDIAPYVFSDIRELYPHLRLVFVSDTHTDTYPGDCILNALITANNLFVRRKSASEQLIAIAEREGLRIIDSKQGYPACTTLSFSKDSQSYAVTCDAGMARLLEKEGVRVTRIGCGEILLPPYAYGFIGGASGVYRDKIYFAGDLGSQSDKDLIRAAAEGAGFECISLSDEPLCDVGGMIFIE
jgi:hypothetical protein